MVSAFAKTRRGKGHCKWHIWEFYRLLAPELETLPDETSCSIPVLVGHAVKNGRGFDIVAVSKPLGLRSQGQPYVDIGRKLS